MNMCKVANIFTPRDESVCMSGSRDGAVKLWDIAARSTTRENVISRNVVRSLIANEHELPLSTPFNAIFYIPR